MLIQHIVFFLSICAHVCDFHIIMIMIIIIYFITMNRFIYQQQTTGICRNKRRPTYDPGCPWNERFRTPRKYDCGIMQRGWR
jgi:hypothetical protein